MKTKIEVHLPLNVDDSDRDMFEPFKSYDIVPLQVKILEEVFVTNSGFSVTKLGLIRESHHHYPDKLHEYISDAAFYYEDVCRNPGNLIILDDSEMYLQIHHPWAGNYWHWLTEAIPRLWMVKDRCHDLILLLPDRYLNLKFVAESLLPFKFKKILPLPGTKSAFVKTLCLPQIKPISDTYDTAVVNQIRAFYLQFFKNNIQLESPFSRRIYLSRNRSTKRKVHNEVEVEALVRRYGFTVINNEDYTFVQQVSIYSQANYLVSIHGAGLTNMIFMKEGSSILEMHKRKTNGTDSHSLVFWYLANALRFKYYHQLCEPTNVDADFFSADFLVDVNKLEANLKFILS